MGRLARIRIADDEVDELQQDITSVLEYVSVVNEIAGDSALTKHPGAVHNVFRADEVTNEAGGETATLLGEAPAVRDQYLVVKKILNTD